ncbi:MAG: sigma-70 family RNA polymerase sigma factor [Gemmataceae bacterium]
MAEIPATRASLLLRLVDRDDAAAWTQFVELYGPFVYGYARRQGLQDADAADLCQDVLLAVAGAVGRLEYDPRRGAFRNWLFTIVRRKLTNRQRAARGCPLGRKDAAMADRLEQLPAAGEDPWQQEWEQRRFAWACEQARAAVGDTTWQAFWLTAIEGLPGKEVAGQLRVSVAAVYHARQRVRTRLEELIRSTEDP